MADRCSGTRPSRIAAICGDQPVGGRGRAPLIAERDRNGSLLRRYRASGDGLGFLMITLALSQVLWGLAYRMSNVTNGDNGIAGLSRPMPFGISLDSAASFYWFALVVATLAFLMMATFVSSSFGSSL